MAVEVLDFLEKAIRDYRQAQKAGPSYGRKGATGTPDSTGFGHGPTGLFSQAGVEQDVISAVVMPEQGLISELPAFPSNLDQPLYQTIVGFDDETGSEPNGLCDNPPKAGPMRGAILTARFGRISRETRELAVERLALRNDRAEPDDLRLVNPFFGSDAMTPQLVNQNPFAGEIQKALAELGVSLQRKLKRLVYEGNPANDVGTGYQEFPGLELLISTGKKDAIAGTAAPALDSIVRNWNYADFDGGSAGIVREMHYIDRVIRKTARQTGCDPLTYALVMREELFYELTAHWACSYMTDRCQVSADSGERVFIDYREQLAFRDAMRNGRFLRIDGRDVRVIFDDGIPEDSSTTTGSLSEGEFASDIYWVPLTVRGTFAATYWEFLNFNLIENQRALARLQHVQVSDMGKFLWITDWVRGCFLMQAIIKPRILLRFPHLAARLQNVRYAPLIHTRQPFPDDGYYVAGGVSSRSAPDYHSEWNTPD